MFWRLGHAAKGQVMRVQPLLFIRILILCLMSQTETVLSQDRATWHAEEWQGGYRSEYPLLYT